MSKRKEQDIMEKNPSINELVNAAHQTAVNHGWWDSQPEFGTLIALCHSELSEALQDYRNGREPGVTYTTPNGPVGIPVELADCVIRIFDLCGQYQIDLQQVIEDKMEYNKTRDYRHGGKVI